MFALAVLGFQSFPSYLLANFTRLKFAIFARTFGLTISNR